MADEDFASFLARVRAGDEQAAADLVKRFDSVIRREVRPTTHRSIRLSPDGR